MGGPNSNRLVTVAVAFGSMVSAQDFHVIKIYAEVHDRPMAIPRRS
jgi:hypothetical protein